MTNRTILPLAGQADSEGHQPDVNSKSPPHSPPSFLLSLLPSFFPPLPSSLFPLLSSFLLLLPAGCATLGLPDPPVEDVGKKRQERTKDAVRDFQKQRDFAEFQAAVARYHCQDVTGCEAGLLRLLQRNTKHLDARLMLAELYLAENRPQEALDQAEQALRDHPDNARGQYTTGLLLDATGQAARALAHYQRAAELEPENELYAISHRTAGEAAGGNHASSAGSAMQMVDFEESADRAGYAGGAADDPQIPISAAVAALRRNQPRQAVELLWPLAQRGCPRAAVFRTLGVAHYRLEDYQSSQLALQHALSLDKSSALTYLLMGCTLAKLGQPESAEACFQHARTIDPAYSIRQ